MSQQSSVAGPGGPLAEQKPLAEQIKALEHLQELDLKIDHITKNKNALPEALKALDQSIGKIQGTLNTKKAALSEIDKVQRQTQAALDINRDRLARSNTRLESVQNSQEYQAIQKELEQLKKLNANLEEQAKKSAGETEAIRKEIEELDAQSAKIRQDRDAQADVLAGQSNQFEGEIDALMSERKQYSSKVESRLLAQYDRVRGARGGLGIVPAVAGRCKGCNMMVPPQMFNEVRKGNVMHSCPSCHRILFVPGGPEGNAGQAGSGSSG